MAAYSDTLASALPRNGLGKADLVVETIFLALNFVCTSFRLWGRRLQNTPLQANDYLILAALVCCSASSSRDSQARIHKLTQCIIVSRNRPICRYSRSGSEMWFRTAC